MPEITINIRTDGGIDTCIQNGQTANGYGTNSSIFAGLFTDAWRGLIEFDLSSIPAGKVITNAKLRLYVVSYISTSNFTFSVHRALTRWYEGNTNNATPTVDGSTWRYRNEMGPASWSGGAGGGSGSDYAATATATQQVGNVGWYEFDVTSDVQGFYDGSLTHRGWWILGAGTNSRKGFVSRNDNVNSTRNPELVITYADAEQDVEGHATGVATVAALGPLKSVEWAEGDAAGAATVAGVITELGGIYGGAAGSSQASGYLYPALYVEGGAVGSSSASALLRHSGSLYGDALGAAQADGDLHGLGELAGGVTGQGAAVPLNNLKGGVYTTGAVTGVASLWGQVYGAGYMDGGIEGLGVTAGLAWAKAVDKAALPVRYADPLLYLTNGEETFDLLGMADGLVTCTWRPAIAQHKDGGLWSSSPLNDGRRLVLRRFANAIEVMELSGKAATQDHLAQMVSDLIQWLERACDYWSERSVSQPVYLVAKAAYETYARYAVIKSYSIPELPDPYRAPVFHRVREAPELHSLILRLERGHWQDTTLGGRCAPISSIRNWTVADWTGAPGEEEEPVDPEAPPPPITTGIVGDVYSLLQAPNGALLAGAGSEARIFASNDDGESWFPLAQLGGGSGIVRDLVTAASGVIFAALTGNSATAGVWRSTNNGLTWDRVKTHPAGGGYYSLAWNNAAYMLVAAGDGVTSSNFPIVGNLNNGAPSAWQDAVVSGHLGFAAQMLGAAAPDYPFLHTAYANQSPQGPEVFVGSNEAPTRTYRVTRTTWPQQINGTLLSSSNLGNGGLAMAAFSVQESWPEYRVKALWAVRSASDTANTEFWAWPHPGESAFPAADRFGLRSTIPGHNVACLYVDKTPDWTNPHRTIWAGGVGRIFVSFNSGINWATATTAPAGTVRALLRTASGRLIAGGSNGEIFIFGGTPGGSTGGGSTGGSSGGSTGGSAGGSRIISATPLGVEETCEELARVANKSAYTTISHVLAYDGAEYVPLQFDADPPYAILGDPAAEGNACYFGSRSDATDAPGGPFAGVCMELSQAANGIGMVWEYWDGAAWETLPARDSSGALGLAGPVSVHWVPPSDWTVTTVDGVTGWWVRVRVTSVASGAVSPLHYPVDSAGELRADRYIYTPQLPYVQIGEGVIEGDIPALARLRWRNLSGNSGVALGANRLLVGLRSLRRGGWFDAYINLSDQQVPFGVTITDMSGSGAFEDDRRAPTGRRYAAAFTTGLNTWQDLVQVDLSTTIARDYYGDFRAFLRARVVSGGAQDWRFRLAVNFGSGGQVAVTAAPFAPSGDEEFMLVDLGALRIPSAAMGGGLISDSLTITVQGRPMTSGIAARLYDLVLIPTDEWAGDFVDSNRNAALASGVSDLGFLDVDSVSDVRTGLRAYNRTESGLVKSVYQSVSNGEVMVQRGAAQRLWFLAVAYDFDDDVWVAAPEIVGSVRVDRVQRYLGWRGKV